MKKPHIKLPPETELLGPGLSLRGGRALRVWGLRSLEAFAPEQVVLALSGARLSVFGQALAVRAMRGGEIQLSGRISSLEWEDINEKSP